MRCCTASARVAPLPNAADVAVVDDYGDRHPVPPAAEDYDVGWAKKREQLDVDALERERVWRTLLTTDGLYGFFCARPGEYSRLVTAGVPLSLRPQLWYA